MSQLTITTTQNVSINFTAASVGERLVAQSLDFLIILAYYVVMIYVMDGTGLEEILRDMDNWSVAAVYIILFLPVFFYSIIQDSLWEGKTVGKKIMKMKVIKIDGYQAGFGDYLIRWLFRLVEVLFPLTIVRFLTIIFSDFMIYSLFYVHPFRDMRIIEESLIFSIFILLFST